MPGEQLVNCRVEDCIIENNRGSGSVAYLVNLNGDSDPVSITYSRCKFRNNKTGVSVTVHKGKTGSVRSEAQSVTSIVKLKGKSLSHWPIHGKDYRFF